MTIFGWDASDFDWARGPMNLVAARQAGVEFFTHKATEGTGTKHAHYGTALSRARDAGVPFLGAYHVVRTNPTISSQVDYLLAYVNQATPWWRDFPGWFFQCDLEKWSYDAVPAQRGVDFCAALEERTGKRVLLYAPKWAYGDSIGGSAPLWASNYVSAAGDFRKIYPGDGSSRWDKYSGRTPAVLQYSSSATFGTQTGCDANAFRGTVEDFARLIGGDDDMDAATAMRVKLLYEGIAPTKDQYIAMGGDGSRYDSLIKDGSGLNGNALAIDALAQKLAALEAKLDALAVAPVDSVALTKAVAEGLATLLRG